MDGRETGRGLSRARDAHPDPRGDVDVAEAHQLVQFYESDEFLSEVVVDYLVAGLDQGEPLVVIATPGHRTALCDRMRSKGRDVDQACAGGQLFLLDAEETLSKLMDGTTLDRERFQQVIGGALERASASRPGARVRAYGEMVDLLWQAGNSQAA